MKHILFAFGLLMAAGYVIAEKPLERPKLSPQYLEVIKELKASYPNVESLNDVQAVANVELDVVAGCSDQGMFINTKSLMMRKAQTPDQIRNFILHTGLHCDATHKKNPKRKKAKV